MGLSLTSAIQNYNNCSRQVLGKYSIPILTLEKYKKQM